MQKSISIIIGHYKDPQNLINCLKSLYENPYFLEIIVTDGEADLKLGEIIKSQFPEVMYMPFEKNLGYGGLLNKGIQASRGEYLLLMNPDVLIPKGALKKLEEFAKANPEVGLIGPRLVYFSGEDQHTYFRFYKPLTIAARRIDFVSKTPWGRKALSSFLLKDRSQELSNSSHIFVDWIMGAVMFTSRAALQKVGIMDERFFLYFEDVDLARRFWEHGLKVCYLKDVTIYHGLKRESAKKKGIKAAFTKIGRIHISSAVKYFKKWGLRYKSFVN